MKANDCIIFQLSKASQSVIRFWGEKIARFNVQPVQGLLLSFLYEEDNITSRELGERAKLDSATLTGIIDRLEAIDLIKRMPNEKDRRAILICLTKKGRQISSEIYEIMNAANLELLSKFDKNEKRLFKEMLLKIRG